MEKTNKISDEIDLKELQEEIVQAGMAVINIAKEINHYLSALDEAKKYKKADSVIYPHFKDNSKARAKNAK